MEKIKVPDPVGIWPSEDWEENCARIEDASELELNANATECLIPDRARYCLLGIFTDPQGHAWLARVNEHLTRMDSSGLAWYEFHSAASPQLTDPPVQPAFHAPYPGRA
jgi:hypothetical protein